MGTLHENKYKFFIISCSVLLRMGNVLGKDCRWNQNTHFVFSNFVFLGNGAVRKIMWKNIVESGGPQMTIWLICIACLITKATDTQTHTHTHTHTFTVCNTYYLFTASMIARIFFNVTLYLHCLCCCLCLSYYLLFSLLLHFSIVAFTLRR
jgi:hypothetical protein